MLTPRKIDYLFEKIYLFINYYRQQIRNYYLKNIRKYFKIFYVICGLISVITLTMEFGFYYPTLWQKNIALINQFVIYYLIFYQIVNFLLADKFRNYLYSHKPEFIIIVFVILQFFLQDTILQSLILPTWSAEEIILGFLAISQIFFIFSNIISFLRSTRIYSFQKVNPSFMFFASFAAIILFGFIGLSFPRMQNDSIPSIDIIFTVISATCVTGLSTIDISSALTFRGQLVLLFLIQIGGLGLITLTSFFAIFLAGQASVKDSMMMKDLLSEDALGKVRKLIRDITLQTLVIETIGSIVLYFSIPEEVPFSKNDKIFFAIFHSISAFCNAGFSLWSGGLAEPIIVSQKSFLSTIMVLVIFGGLGFGTIRELYKKAIYTGIKHYRLSVSTKLILISNITLLSVGTLFYLLMESSFSLKALDFEDSLFHSFFYSVTTRTAGFNTLNLAEMGVPITFFSLFLMWIGAAPNSTGGGIKTTTLALSILQIYHFVRGKEKVEIFNRQIAPISMIRASITIVLSLFVIFTAIFLIILTESFPFLDICFEVVSAFGTVGLTRGITTELGLFSKIVICFVMFMGRVGILTILIAMIPKQHNYKYSYPSEYVIVG